MNTLTINENGKERVFEIKKPYVKHIWNRLLLWSNDKIIKEIIKPKEQKFPIVFENDYAKIEVYNNYFKALDKTRNENFIFDENQINMIEKVVPLLIKAIDKLKEMRK